MRLFKSNKSQGSLQNISAGRSPLHSPIDSPLQSPAFPPPQSAAYGPGGAQYDESVDVSDSQRYYSSDEQQTYPAHFASRGQSQDIPSHGYQGRPTVNIIPDQFDENRPVPSGALSATQQERRQQKHSKKSLFGLHSSKDNTSHPPPPVPTLGRRLSTRKRGPGPESQEGSIPQSTPAQYSGEGHSSDTHAEKESSNEYIPSQTHTEPDEQYYRQQNHFDSPQIQTSSHYSSQYQDEESHQNPQQTYNRPHPPRPSETSNPYVAYNPQLDRPSLDIYDPYRTIRPPSQQSLGPPSPITSVQQSNESRPSATPARLSNQSSLPSHLQPQTGMARGQDSNPSMRQQPAQQYQQGAEQGHGQYGIPPGARQAQQHSEHGRNTPPPNKNREEFSSQDYTLLLQKHEELRTSSYPFSFPNHG